VQRSAQCVQALRRQVVDARLKELLDARRCDADRSQLAEAEQQVPAKE
jgi:hypothetical protein